MSHDKRASSTILSSAFLFASVMSTVAVFATTDAAAQAKGEGKGDDALPDQGMGQRFEITSEGLPQPDTKAAVDNAPLIVPRGEHTLRVPAGFEATIFAEGLTHPRRLLVLPNGDVIVAEQKPGYLTLLRDGDGDGRAEWVERHAMGFEGPYGLEWRDGEILVADQIGVWAVPHKLKDVRAGHGEQKPIDEVPPEERKPSPNAYGQKLVTGRDVFGIVAGHVNRDIAIGPDGRIYVGVGSSGNIGVEPEPKATIQVFSAAGGEQRAVATGMRNPTDLAFHPATNDLWTLVQERDGLGDRLVPDYLTRVKEGAFYGWPYFYIGSHPQPGFAEMLESARVRAPETPDLLFEAHSSAMGLAFYEGAMFPDEYRGDAFVALKGSWNRSEPTGYKVVRVDFEGGQPRGGYENFATGFWVGGRERAEVWGRPAAVAVSRDGALLIADDTGGTIWRIAYREQRESRSR